MPVALTYPGVYVEELESPVHTITGVATSITAFVGRTTRGPTDRPALLQGFPDFVRLYGGLSVDSTLAYAVQQFFLNGGSQAVVARVHKDAKPASLAIGGGTTLTAANEGKWGDQLVVHINDDTREKHDTPPTSDPKRFNLYVQDTATKTSEAFRNVSIDPADPRYILTILQQQSQLVRATAVGATLPTLNTVPAQGVDPFSNASFFTAFNVAGSDGAAVTAAEVAAGIPLLDKADLINILCIPPFTRDVDVDQATWDAAAVYARSRKAMLIVDAPQAWADTAAVVAGLGSVMTPTDTAAIYFPRVLMPDSLAENRLQAFAPCGVVAGVYARTDTNRGVWKAPAGTDASLIGVSALTTNGFDPALLSDAENGVLNPLGVNCLRNFPVIGRVVWGARTMRGADVFADQWKYVPVRRLAYFIEQSLYRGTQWVVFEPNDEPLWAQIRLNVGDFMQSLFRQGAFQGSSPKDAYQVKCDHETTTQVDIDNGIVNILVGFAPLKPAEFVVLQIQQIRAQS
ncbi:MAG: phage tail sheath C-terminal domain-containing protein [Luteibacter sp.]